MMQSETITIQ